MTATSTTRRPERLTTHLAAPGARIVPAPGVNSWSSYGRDYCHGDVRALYGRDKTKAWQRVGWVCTRCGTVELEAGLIGTEREYYARHRAKLDPSVGFYGTLLPVSTPPAAAPGVDTGGRQSTAEVEPFDGRRARDVAGELDELLSAHVAGTSAGDRNGVTPPSTSTWDPKAQVQCSCGDQVSARNLARHKATARHARDVS